MRVSDVEYEALKRKTPGTLCDEDAARLLIGAVERELARGTEHFHPRTGAQLFTVDEVLSVLSECGAIVLGGALSEAVDTVVEVPGDLDDATALEAWLDETLALLDAEDPDAWDA